MAVMGFAGHSQHGKDTAARVLVDCFGFKTVAFADPVRTGLLALDPYVECGYLVYRGMHEANLPVPPCYERLSGLVRRFGWDTVKKLPEVRRLKQRFGTEAGRDLHGEDCWVDKMRDMLDDIEGDVAITDVRFSNEATLVHDYGGLVYLIHRPNFDNGVAEHSSEPDDFSWADAVILNNSTLEALRLAVKDQFARDFKLEWTQKVAF